MIFVVHDLNPPAQFSTQGCRAFVQAQKAGFQGF